jgi:dienelactone hydrolase
VNPNRRTLRVAIGTGLALPALAIAGEAIGPSELELPAVPEAWAYRSLPPLPPTEWSAPPSVGPIRREEMRISVRDTVLGATLLAPQQPGRYPAVVFVHGAGPGHRSALLNQAEYLARAGIVALIYDKRTVGYSFASRDFGLLAEDALTAVRMIRARPEVDPARVGLWGVSEGGWVVPIAATRSNEVAFVILVSAPNVSPQSQAVWAVDDHLRRIGAPEGLRHVMTRAFSMGEFNYSRHDPVPPLEATHQPALALYGTDDHAIPVLQSSRVLVHALDDGGNRAYSIRFFGGADHDLRVGDGFALGYLETMANWVLGLPASAEPPPDARIAGVAPVQERRAIEPPESPFGTAVLIGAFGLAAAGYLAGPAGVLLDRRRRGRGRAAPARSAEWSEIRRLLRRLAAAGISSAVLTSLLIGVMVAFLLLETGSGAIAQGGWLVVRLAAVTALALEVAAVDTTVSTVRAGWRPSPTQAAAVIGGIGATGILLLVAAYLGVFAPRCDRP